MKGRFTEFEITFQGNEYIVEVRTHKKDTTVYIEYKDLDEEIEEQELENITAYLIEEGFVEYNEK